MDLTGARDGYCGHWEAGALAVRECRECRSKQHEIDLLRAEMNGLRYQLAEQERKCAPSRD